MTSLNFAIPKKMDPVAVAKTFTAYLMGHRSFDYTAEHMTDDQLRHGPFRKEGSEYDWQLDDSNDFLLQVRRAEAWISCRYQSQEPALKAMVDLFEARFCRHPRT